PCPYDNRYSVTYERVPSTWKHTLTGSISLPFLVAFYLSLTVLVQHPSLGSIYPWEMVLPDSDGIPRVPPYSGSTSEETLFRLQGCYLLWLIFPDRFV